ncbi:hypothetical protein BDR03DRAFT_1018884 [Suillus americanus]|nr:hypothetical protein BDR03DRAFT_1018884 [Suillus americanus]
MTSPARHNRCHAAHNNQEMPPPPVPQPNFVPANLLQVVPVPRPFAWQPPLNFSHQPLPVGQYPGLPRNAIAHVQRAHALPPVDYNARLNDQMNDRDEIRQQAQAELWAAGMQPMQQPHIPNESVQPAPPAPPVYGAIHYEGAVGPHNFDNPLRYFAPNPAPPLHAPPEPDYCQFNIQFRHHFQEEQLENEHIRNDLLQRQAQEELHRQQIQLQLQQQFQQQEAEHLNREAQQDQDALHLQQHQDEQMNRHNKDVQRAGQQADELHHLQQQRVCEQEERLEEALREYNDPVSQKLRHQDQERRRTQEQELHMQREAEDQQYINQVVPVPEGGRPYREPIILHTLGSLDVECPNCHARHSVCEKLTSSSLRCRYNNSAGCRAFVGLSVLCLAAIQP